MEISWVLYIAAAIALLAIAVLCVKLIQFFGSLQSNIDGLSGEVRKTVETVNSQIGSIQGQVDQIMKNVAGISGQAEQTLSRVNTSVDRVNEQLGEVQGIVANLKEISGDAERMTEDVADVVHGSRTVVLSLMDLEQNIQRKVQMPVVEMLSVFSALGRGIRVFRKRLGGDGATVRRFETDAESEDSSEANGAPADEKYSVHNAPPAGVPG